MDGSLSVVERLPFTLPDFTRYSWVGERVRQVWEPRLERISRAWFHVEWLSVVAGVRACGLIWLRPEALPTVVSQWSASRLSAVALQIKGSLSVRNRATPESHPPMICVGVGTLDKIARLRQAWDACNHETVGELLGYPSCCRRFFQKVWVEQHYIDTTWAMATNTTDLHDGIALLESKGSHLANILWRWLGVRAVPHLPCRFDCGGTIELGERLLHVGEQAGYDDEMTWIREILSWPVEWSALHGIAEVKTPILKISTRTDATASKYVVRWQGTSYPQEGAVGLRFPYQAPMRPMMSSSQVFQRGLNHHIEQETPRPDWYHADNGFTSPKAMSLLHQPIVALARRELDGLEGNVLDLGCGNGVLLAKICSGYSSLIPYGVDNNTLSLEHARELLPQFAKNFVQGDLFDTNLWSGPRRYVLTLFMIGRLLEVTKPRAVQLMERLRAKSERVLVYIYPDWSNQSLEVVARQMGLDLQEPVGETVGLLARF